MFKQNYDGKDTVRYVTMVLKGYHSCLKDLNDFESHAIIIFRQSGVSQLKMTQTWSQTLKIVLIISKFHPV